MKERSFKNTSKYNFTSWSYLGIFWIFYGGKPLLKSMELSFLWSSRSILELNIFIMFDMDTICKIIGWLKNS
jgi:hypothetical protein